MPAKSVVMSQSPEKIFDLNNIDEIAAGNYLAAIVNSSDDAIIGKNLNGVIISWNNSAERIFGYTAEEAIGQHINLIIPVGRTDEEFVILGKVKSGQPVKHFETIRRRKDGRMIDISLSVSPIRDANGVVIGASKIARDVTEQRRTERELADSNRRKEEFLANISHELRTPMNAVIGLANILDSSTTLTEKEHKYVSTLKQSADSLMALINSLLDFSKLETGTFELEEIEYDLPDIIHKTNAMFSFKAKEKNLSLRVLYTTPINKFYVGDPLRLQQLLNNLLSNSIKFTDRGTIDLKIGVKKIDSDRTALLIDVVDTGIGIPQNKIDAVFDKFVQADASTTRKYGGSGLGLAICKTIVGKMGGTIKASSLEGVGTTFSLELPVRNSPTIQLLTPSDETSVSSKKNILVVEDYEPNMLVITTLLEQMGYDFDTAEDGLEALKQFQNGTYDVVLMDVQMRGMDGFESTTHMRAYETEKGLRRTPIVAMTAHVAERDKHQCMEVGMDDFLPKPFDPVQLRKILGHYITLAAE